MDKCINAEILKKHIKGLQYFSSLESKDFYRGYNIALSEANAKIDLLSLYSEYSKELPEIVYCNDCKYSKTFEECSRYLSCSLTTTRFAVKPTDFCSYGEKRENKTAE